MKNNLFLDGIIYSASDFNIEQCIKNIEIALKKELNTPYKPPLRIVSYRQYKQELVKFLMTTHNLSEEDAENILKDKGIL